MTLWNISLNKNVLENYQIYFSKHNSGYSQSAIILCKNLANSLILVLDWIEGLEATHFGPRYNYAT